MNIKLFAAAALLLLAAPSRAYDRDTHDPVQAFRAQAEIIRWNSLYAKYVVCSNVPEAAQLGSLRIYTRLNDVGPRAALPHEGHGHAQVTPETHYLADETRLNEYGSQTVTYEKLRVVATSCDTQDYEVTFDMNGLVRASQGIASQPVTGHVLTTTRGETEFDADIPCTAFW